MEHVADFAVDSRARHSTVQSFLLILLDSSWCDLQQAVKKEGAFDGSKAVLDRLERAAFMPHISRFDFFLQVIAKPV